MGRVEKLGVDVEEPVVDVGGFEGIRGVRERVMAWTLRVEDC